MPKPSRQEMNELEEQVSEDREVKEEVEWWATDQTHLKKMKKEIADSDQKMMEVIAQIRREDDERDQMDHYQRDPDPDFENRGDFYDD